MSRTEPRASGPDQTLALARDPYRWIARQGRALGAEVFRGRLLGERTHFLVGEEAARLLYDPERFARAGAMPEPVRATLLGEGGVQTLDGERHRRRKAMFMALLGPERVPPLVAEFERCWREAAQGWALHRRIGLAREAQGVLGRAAARWSGVPLGRDEADRRIADLALLFDRAAAKGPGHLRSRLARRRCDRWIAGLVRDVRAGRLHPPEGSALRVIAAFRDVDGEPLPERVAAVEVLNVLRPIVALSAYVAFAAHALLAQPGARAALRRDDPASVRRFVLEVRRFYPFFPAVAARVRVPFEWRGARFRPGELAVLSIHGTGHDPERWPDPERFCPDRFREREPGAFDVIPQGGGDHLAGHRCAGEWVSEAILARAVELLAFAMRFRVPEQAMRVRYGRMPGVPAGGILLADPRMERA